MRTVLITGASAGIGEAAARRFSAAGDRLILVARRKDRLDALAKSLGTPCENIVLDVTDRKGVEEKLGPLQVDVLLNNAGMALGMAKAQDAALDDWDRVIDLNVKAFVYVTRALLPGLVAKRGHIVTLGSVAGSVAYTGGNVYGASKAFVEKFAGNLRSDLLGTGVRVTNIEPGKVDTDFSLVRHGGDASKARAEYAGYQALSADDIAETIVWAVGRPAHVDISRIEIFPTVQAGAGFSIHKT